MMEKTTALWLLVDGNNIVFKDAVTKGPEAGQQFGRRLQLMIQTFGPLHTVVAFDTDGPTFRHEIDQAYKGHRSERPEHLGKAIEDAKEACYELSADVVSVSGFEADDCIATLVRIARERNDKVVVASSDKDLNQLLEPDWVTKLEKCGRHHSDLVTQWLTAKDVADKFGVTPSQWIDYQTLVGDATDGIKGCPMIGEKTAASLLKATKSLKGFYDSPFRAPLTDKQRNSLLAYKERARDVWKLVSLRKDVPLPEVWNQ